MFMALVRVLKIRNDTPFQRGLKRFMGHFAEKTNGNKEVHV